MWQATKECKADFISEHIHDKGHGGRTALHYAAGGKDDNANTIRLLVEWGADVNAQDDALFTPLHELALCGQGYDNRWTSLIDCGADVTIKEENGSTSDDIIKCGIKIQKEWCKNHKR